MTASTLLILAAAVGVFAVFTAVLAWAQPHARDLSAAPVEASRRRRRPF